MQSEQTCNTSTDSNTALRSNAAWNGNNAGMAYGITCNTD